MYRSKLRPIIFLSFLAILFSHYAFAQTERGAKLLGGNASLRFHDPFSINVTPNLGIFVADNLALGGAFTVSHTNGSEYSNFRASLSPFARYYFGDGATRPVAQAMAGYGRFRHRFSDIAGETTSSFGYGMASLGFGVTHFLTRQIGVEAILNYSGIFDDSFYGNLYLSFGFQIYLPASKNN